MRRLLAGTVAVGVLSSAGALGSGAAAADPDAQTDTVYTVGGAKFPGIPWYEYTDRSGKDWYPNARRVVVDYPAGILEGLLPVVGGPGVGRSIVTGTDNLNAAIGTHGGGPERAVGLSEGALVLDAEQARLAGDAAAPPPDRLSFTTFGSPVARHGFGQSFLTTMFPPGTFLPGIEYTTPAPVDSQYDTTVVATAYDAIADFPDRPDNPVAVANALVGAAFFHTPVAFTSPTVVPPQNITSSVNSRGATTTTYLVPANQLPLTLPLRLAGVSDEMADEVGRVLQPMVDAGYSRNDDPLSRPTGVDPVAGMAPMTDVDPVADLDPAVRADFDALVKNVQGLLPAG